MYGERQGLRLSYLTKHYEYRNLSKLLYLIAVQIAQLFLRNYVRLRTAVAQWLRCCARNRKVAGLIPDGVIGIFH